MPRCLFCLIVVLPLLAGCAAREPSEAPSSDAPAAGAPMLESFIEIYDLASQTTRTVLHAEAHYEAPNWSPDGTLIFNGGGRLYRVPVEGGTPELIDTGDLTRINNDHGLSPDGQLIAITDNGTEPDGAGVHIYTMPVEGGPVTRVTQNAPSYWHGWSPDGSTLVYCARRDGNYDIWAIPAGGGEEWRLTDEPGHEDGPDYSPDGRYVYYNGDAAGNFDIWRIPAAGGEPEQVTDDAYNDWFPHPSPDGRYIVMLSYDPGTEGHPANRNVRLRMMTVDGDEVSEPVDLFELFGGQGTINVPSWSPDSRAFAFVRYRLSEGDEE